MFLHQKLGYKYKHITTEREIDLLCQDLRNSGTNYAGFDTETTGLNIVVDKPFLVSFGFGNNVYTFDYNPCWFNSIFDTLEQCEIPAFAHNAKYDYHMVQNGGSPISDNIKLYDSITVARLTENADERESMSLEALGTKYIDDEAKFAGHIIKDIIHKIDKESRTKLRDEIVKEFPNDKFATTTTKTGTIKATGKLTKLVEEYEKTRTKWVNDNNPYFAFIDKHFRRANYEDVYKREPELMRNYAADDIVIMLEYLKKHFQFLKK